MKATEISNYIILQETVLKYKKEEQIVLMLIRNEENKFILEVIDLKLLVGRQVLGCRSQAESLFEEITERLSEYDNYFSARSMLSLSFALKSRECRFLIQAFNRAWSYSEIKRMAKPLGYIASARSLVILFDLEEPSFVIKIFFLGSKEHIGTFTSSESENENEFYFSFNQDFLLDNVVKHSSKE